MLCVLFVWSGGYIHSMPHFSGLLPTYYIYIAIVCYAHVFPCTFGVSPPSGLNGRFFYFIYLIYIFVTYGHCTHVRASNVACTLSHLPTILMCSIPMAGMKMSSKDQSVVEEVVVTHLVLR